MENKWQGFISEILSARKPYVDTKKKLVIDGKLLVEKTVRNEDMVISWTENDKQEILDVRKELT